MAHVIPLYPARMSEHRPCRTFREAVADKVRFGQLSPAAAISAFVDSGGLTRDQACREVESILREMTQ